jgi:hypothetical protein
MAIVQGIREKVHLPIYDSIYVKPGEQLRGVESSSTLRFFVDVQRKTNLETNLQSASLLPHYNTFEARAMRVVISDLPAEFSSEFSQPDTDYDVLGPNGLPLVVPDPATSPRTYIEKAPVAGVVDPRTVVRANIDLTLDLVVDLLKDASDSEDGTAFLDVDDPDTTTEVREVDANNQIVGAPLNPTEVGLLANKGCFVELTVDDLLFLLDEFSDNERPLDEQLFSNNGSGNLIGKLIYNTVTSLYVGEKLMIQMPTWFFPAGAGPYSESGTTTTHGSPSPQDTFRFAEPIFIDKQQNFRVEIDIPDADVLRELQRIYGPFWMWVVLDGYMTRGVQ